MTKEEKREYAAQYRREGYGANADARYRERWLERVRERDRERKRAKRLGMTVRPQRGHTS